MLGGKGRGSGKVPGSEGGVRTRGKYEAGCFAMEPEDEGLNHPMLWFDEGVARVSVDVSDGVSERGDVDKTVVLCASSHRLKAYTSILASFRGPVLYGLNQ